MPRLNDSKMVNKKSAAGSYGYSAVRLEHLGASEYTLVTIVQDVSSSVTDYKKDMEACLKEIVKSCTQSARSDNLMIRFLQFADELDETHGFKMLEQCAPADYERVLKVGGCTALYDAAENAIAATAGYGKDLTDNDFSVNGIVFIITDGCDNRSTSTVNGVRKALQSTIREEALESMVSVLIGVGTKDSRQVSKMLKEFKKQAGLTQYVELERADAKSLGSLAQFVSQSISCQSQALGTGGPSQQISLTF